MPASTGARWQRPGWWCCMTRCCTIFCWANWTKPPTLRSSFTTTASGIAAWRASCGAGARASGADRRYFDFPMLRADRGACARRGGAQSGGGAKRCASTRRGARVVEIPHLFAPPRAAPAWPRPCAPAAAGRGPGDVPFRRLRLPAGIQAAGERAGGLRRSASRPCRGRRCWWPASSFRATWNGPSRRCWPRPASRGGRISRSANSGWRRGAVDACINLRYPAAGETSGIAIRLMGIGKPVLMTDRPECSRFPEDACMRIAPGVAERDSLREHMTLLHRCRGGGGHRRTGRGAYSGAPSGDRWRRSTGRCCARRLLHSAAEGFGTYSNGWPKRSSLSSRSSTRNSRSPHGWLTGSPCTRAPRARSSAQSRPALAM